MGQHRRSAAKEKGMHSPTCLLQRRRGEQPPRDKALVPGCVTLCPAAWEDLGALQLLRKGWDSAPRDVVMQAKRCTLVGEVSRGRKAELRGCTWAKVSLRQ